MRLDPYVLAAIAAMTVATLSTRAGGYFVFRRLKPSAGLRSMLGYVPGTLFVAYVVPALAQGHAPEWAGAAAVAALMLATRQAAVAILGGTVAAWAVWSWL